MARTDVNKGELNNVDVMKGSLNVFQARSSYLDLIRNDDTRTKLFADLIRPRGVEVTEAQEGDLPLSLQVLQVPEGGEAALEVRVVVPVDLTLPKP